MYKIAGALAQQGASLDEVYDIAQWVASRIGTIGVGLEHCHVSAFSMEIRWCGYSLEPTFNPTVLSYVCFHQHNNVFGPGQLYSLNLPMPPHRLDGIPQQL